MSIIQSTTMLRHFSPLARPACAPLTALACRAHSTVARAGAAADNCDASATLPPTHNKHRAKWLMTPPQPDSGIRLIQFPPAPSRGPVTQRFYSEWEATMAWHHDWWRHHNREYHAELAAFEAAMVRDHGHVKDEDRARFWQEFLDKAAPEQTAYYRAWIKRLCGLILVGGKAAIEAIGGPFGSRVGQ
ncbi:hypothetical protein AMAG_05131 [Allomyces macrogynus ATCC 38327]|uniref:Apoptogenic protein 1, mitochondrial n=1 Tax=Allomyces macrogynus (strain ATCC 38327) TaxID=578462 RepID=A0A0L0SB47_ALLM3|nr:hypothetical protein AMAG_05131 [Allomyces macrogynus ATCC 38327]|eukprot:KNE59657.1 hypothetical protein AMAG_05131 [Allomyces macrogynus ATCC 38327]